MQLEDFFDYKNQMVKDIITNETIVSLIKMDTPMEKAESLIYTQVFPYEYIPETVQKGQTFVCIDVDIQSVSSKTFLTPIIYVWVFAHSSNIRLPEGGVRTDKLCSEICKVVNGSRYYGLGELNLYSVKRFAPMTDYQGKLMTFTAREFNRQFDGTKSTPSNRKEGR
jgi:hypothetical protein